MEEQKPIKDTKEMVIAGNEIGVFSVKRFKDGIQYNDFEAFYQKFVTDPEFKEKLKAGWEGKQNIPGELRDIDMLETIELVTVQISYVPKYAEALKS